MQADLTFGGWLKRRRGGLGLTQKALARQVGYAEVTLRKVEADELRPSWQMAQKLAEALQIAPEEQAQFIRFARDELGECDLELPTQAHASVLPVALSSPPSNLPIQSTPFFGREQELRRLATLLANPQCRLLTLIGPGGVGKTRLAIQTATEHSHAYTDGVAFVALVALASAESLAGAIATALHCSFSTQHESQQHLLDYLREKKLLLVLDNFEHLLEGIALLVDILQGAPQVTLLVTSRQRLHLQGEWVFEVAGLELPPVAKTPGMQFEQYSAVALFLQRAHQVHAAFAPGEHEKQAIVQICRLVEGMPLAIELAASWAPVLSCGEIAGEIERGLDILTSRLRDASLRHRSLEAVFEHSWRLLTAEEQRLFAQLSVFRGCFTRQAAAQVAGATLLGLSALLDKSLLRRADDGTYEIHEFTRQFAAAKLQELGEREATRQRHEAYFVALAEEELDQVKEDAFIHM